MKPFIHLFETPENYYFYDVNKNKNVKVDYDLYQYLHNMIYDTNKFIFNEFMEEKIRRLQKQGYLSENRIKEIRHPDTDMLRYYLNRKLHLLTIQLTHACNLRCSYCPYTSNDGTYRLHGNKKISFETIKKALIFLRDSSVDSNNVTIAFYGGEPLIEFELIRKTINYCKEIFVGKDVNYTITTNGTLLSDEMLELFEKENFQVVISLDGPKELNDRNRKFANDNKSVFEEVIEKIIYISENYKRLLAKLFINMVIDPTQDFTKYILLFEDNPILNDINIRAGLVEDDYKTEKYLPTEEFRAHLNYVKFLSYLHYMGEINMSENKFYKSMFYQAMNKMWKQMSRQITLGDVNCPSGPCIPGSNKLMVNVDGLLFPCEKVSENIEFNCIGNVNDGIDIEKAGKMLNIAQSIAEDCRNCFAFRHCTLCVKGHECRVIDENKMKEKCKNVRYNFHNELVGKEILNEINMN